MRLTGKALLAADPDPALAMRGFDVSLEGLIEYDLRADRFSRFDIVAVGDHWGESSLTRGARPGRSPLGILFELSTGDSPAEKIAPQGAREKGAYFGLYR